jgi:type IV pilus secretin PilQ/predicted competence protein
VAQLDVRPKQVLIEAKLVEVDLDNSLDYGIQWNYLSQDQGKFIDNKSGLNTIGGPVGITNAGTPTQGIGTGVSQAINGLSQPLGATGQGTGVSLPAQSIFGALTLGRITDNYILNMTLTAAASAGKVKVLSDPKVATLNNEPANINVTNSIPYVTSNVASTGVTSANVQYLLTGIQLTVTPTINADGRITLDINPTVSQPGTQASGQAAAIGAPSIESRNAKTTVLVKDGETIVIGGLISESLTDNISKIPVLGDIPVLGWLFKSKHVDRTRTELLIFVTPNILPD